MFLASLDLLKVCDRPLESWRGHILAIVVAREDFRGNKGQIELTLTSKLLPLLAV